MLSPVDSIAPSYNTLLMSAIDSRTSARKTTRVKHRPFEGPRADDPRVVRTRAAVVEAARTLFLRNGYAGTTMDEIATLAGLTKRTVYNNYGDKDALFSQIIAEMTSYADEFARGLREEFEAGISAANLLAALHDIAQRLALGVVRTEVVNLRRLLIGEARVFPAFARDYFDSAPGQVIDTLASGFDHLGRAGVLSVTDPRTAAAQFAYLVAGEPLDRAMLVGTLPSREHIQNCAREGVETFLARYAPRHAERKLDATPRSSRKG
jgi:TetR/AcrR family transcriptional repressor of mexJK operon